MSENKNIEATPTAFGHLKNSFKMLFQKQYKNSLREFWYFIKAICITLKTLYVKYIKGQYITVKGKRIPRAVLLVFALLILYLISPMSFIFSGAPQTAEQKTESANVYDKDGLKVYNIRKCDVAACGIIEYRGEQDIEKVRIAITFYDPAGQPTYEGQADALQLTPNTRTEFTIPCEEDFGYFKLKGVYINPKDEPENSEEEIQ